MSHALQHSTPSTGSPFPVPRSLTHCHDLLPHQGDTSAELPPPAGYEPNGIVDDQVNMHFTEDDQIAELEGRVESLSYNRSFLPSTYDSAEKHRDATGSGLRWRTTSCSAGFTTAPTGARSKCRTVTSLSLRTRKLDVQFISRSDNWRHRETCRSVFKQRSDQETVSARVSWIKTFSDRDQCSLKHQQVFGSNEPIFRFSNPANVAKSLLDGNRDHLLTQARSELMQHEHQVGSLNTCSINELQQQTYAQRLEIGRRPSRICRISKRASPTARRVGYKKERTSRQSD